MSFLLSPLLLRVCLLAKRHDPQMLVASPIKYLKKFFLLVGANQFFCDNNFDSYVYVIEYVGVIVCNSCVVIVNLV